MLRNESFLALLKILTIGDQLNHMFVLTYCLLSRPFQDRN
jgi:hypothetical protein